MSQQINDTLSKKDDSVRVKLPNPFLRKGNVLFLLSHRQMIDYWMYQHRQRIWTEMSKNGVSSNISKMNKPSLIDWNFSHPGVSDFGFEYRESSLYLPVNVREYSDYKMGRSRFVPIASLAFAGFLAQKIYQRFGHILKQREESRYFGIKMSERQIKMMIILWKEKSSLPSEWYTKYHQKYSLDNITFQVFEKDIMNLENAFLLKRRKYEDGFIRYFPAISKSQLILHLKEELSFVEGQKRLDRMNQIKFILKKLDEF